MKRSSINDQIKNSLVFIVTFVVFIGACMELYNVAWGTGVALGEFSLKWIILFIVFVLLCIFMFAGIVFSILRRVEFLSISKRWISHRKRTVILRRLLAIIVLILPVIFLQYTMWGIVFQGVYIRTLIWAAAVFILASLITEKEDALIGWKEFLASLILTASIFTIAVSLQGVTDYPFSLGWSEGNRLWDYSTLFGRALYDYPADQDIYVLLDGGRLLVGGLPFLIPGLTIEMARLWVGLTLILPYFIVGLAAFRISAGNYRIGLLITFWIFLFLKQGPIHAPLVLCAALTVLLWGRPLWISIPLIIFAGNFAQASRFTWMFAPGIWIGMLEISGASLRNGKLDSNHWVRAIALGVAGVFGGYLLPKIIPLFQRDINVTTIGEQIASTGYNLENIAGNVSQQPLLWYRLLPNSTYGNGILFGLLIAVGPLLIILFWLAIKKKWLLNVWQKLVISGSLIAFLVVGLVASTKIGGGGDLHNMDMFLIGLMFIGLVAWLNGASEVILNANTVPDWMKIVIIASLIIPAIGPWRQMRSHYYGEKASALVVLTDAPDEKSLDLLPSGEIINKALEKIQDETAIAKEAGEVLFLDQRQLLTFGYVADVPLVPEYEKKVLMNEALSANAEYFQPFYEDLAAGRFSLIISERFFTPIKDSSYEFGEENNAWVKWVANPVLCYYQEKTTLKEVGVQLLIPKTEPVDCSSQLPSGLPK
ncbi:MAG: hypothetical protein Q7J80_17380 [Anaerolineales bacterium]|nr:hypothetical protein [Anaerolineales bacterium]